MPDVFSKLGGFFTTVQGAILFVYGLVATDQIKNILAQDLHHQRKEFLAEDHKHEHEGECVGILALEEERKDRLIAQLKSPIDKQKQKEKDAAKPQTGAEITDADQASTAAPTDEEMVKYLESQIERFKSIQHTFAVDSKMEIMQKVILQQAKQIEELSKKLEVQ